MRKINKIILHCSDSEIGNAEIINAWHLERGFKSIGYHFVILKDGTIEKGRPVSEAGAHCKGHNFDSIGICLIGKNTFTHEAFESLACILVILLEKYRLGADDIYGHNFFDEGKTCPNFQVEMVRSGFRKTHIPPN